MNKIKQLFGILFLLSIIFIGCEKENELFNTQNNEENIPFKLEKKVTNYGIDFKERSTDQNLENLIINLNDKEDEKINTNLYYLMLSLKNLTNYTEFNYSVIELAKQNSFQTANLMTLTKNNKILNDIINNNLENEISKANNNLNVKSLQEIEQNLTYNTGKTIEKYTPIIYIPNLKTCNPQKNPLFAISVSVNSDNDETIEENIIAYYYDESNVLHTTLLSEEEAMKTSNPIFIIDNGSMVLKENKINFQNYSKENTKTVTSFHTHEYRINHRYENSGKSEFCITAAIIIDANTGLWVIPKNNNTSLTKEWNKIASVDKDDIGEDLGRWVRFTNRDKDDKYIYFNTFERDWYSSRKNLGSGAGNGGTCYLYGNMKYENNWYSFDPSQSLTDYWVDLNRIYWDWAKWYNSDKSKLRLWRVEL